MKARQITVCLMIVLAQVLLNVYCAFTPFLVLNLLPIIIIALPQETSTPGACLLAFACGIAADYFSTGTVGLSAAALLPVAALRPTLIRMVSGGFITFGRDESPFRRLDTAKILLLLMLAFTVMLAPYVWMESAGLRPFWFNLLRVGLSVVANSLFGLVIVRILYSNGH